MLDQQTIETLARRLNEAERTKSQLRMFTADYPDLAI